MVDTLTAPDRSKVRNQEDEPRVEIPRDRLREKILPIYDFLSIVLLPLFTGMFMQGTDMLEKNDLFWSFMAVVTVLLINSYGGYRHNRPRNFLKSTSLAIKCYIATSFAMLAVAVLVGHGHAITRPQTWADLGVTPFLLAWARSLPKGAGLRDAAMAPQNGPVIICYDRCKASIRKALVEHQIGTQISGILYLSPQPAAPQHAIAPELQDIQSLLAIIESRSIQDVIFIHHPGLDAIAAEDRQQILSELLSFPTRLWLAINIENELPDILKNRSGSYRLVPLVTDQLITSQSHTKRLFDLVAGSLLMIGALPLLALSALLVRLSGPGPVIFRQVRIGAHGHRFELLKFRTMRHDTAASFQQAARQDLRVTHIGGFLRKTSLDELPQLLNVLKGDMSLIGPRPHAPETRVAGLSFDTAVKFYRLRHRVKPGLTGLAQIRGQRGETPAIQTLEQRLASDLEYIETWSPWLDIWILLRTIPVVLRQTNAW
jgi:exopolysaccharide biosynthesis polyprenyl glycosylphosphotransferase